MKIVAILAFMIATTADIVPDAGPYLALVAGALAGWSFPGAPKLAVATIFYCIMGTVVHSPEFVVLDLVTPPQDVPEVAAGVVSSVNALATGTAPKGLEGGTELSTTTTTILVLLQLAALGWGIRRKMALSEATVSGAADEYDYERSPYE